MWLASWKASQTGEQELGHRGLCAAPDEGFFWAVGEGRNYGVEEEELQVGCPYNNKVPDSFIFIFIF